MSLWIRVLAQRAVETGLPIPQVDEFLAWIRQELRWREPNNEVAESSALVDVPRLVREFRRWRLNYMDTHSLARRRRSETLDKRTSRRHLKKSR